MNVTAVSPTAAGFVSIRPADAPGAPTTSSLNLDAGDIVPNAVTIALPTTGDDTGTIELTFDAYGTPGPSTDILADIVGYYTAAGTPTGGAPEGPPGPQGPPGTAKDRRTRNAQGPPGPQGPAGALIRTQTATAVDSLGLVRARHVDHHRRRRHPPHQLLRRHQRRLEDRPLHHTDVHRRHRHRRRHHRQRRARHVDHRRRRRHPLVSYLDVTQRRLEDRPLHHTRCTAVTANAVDTAGAVGFYTSITVGADGIPLVSYQDIINGHLKVARAPPLHAPPSPPTPSTPPATSGSFTSITVGADGIPLISYFDGDQQRLEDRPLHHPHLHRRHRHQPSTPSATSGPSRRSPSAPTAFPWSATWTAPTAT